MSSNARPLRHMVILRRPDRAPQTTGLDAVPYVLDDDYTIIDRSVADSNHDESMRVTRMGSRVGIPRVDKSFQRLFRKVVMRRHRQTARLKA